MPSFFLYMTIIIIACFEVFRENLFRQCICNFDFFFIIILDIKMSRVFIQIEVIYLCISNLYIHFKLIKMPYFPITKILFIEIFFGHPSLKALLIFIFVFFNSLSYLFIGFERVYLMFILWRLILFQNKSSTRGFSCLLWNLIDVFFFNLIANFEIWIHFE